MSVIETDRPTKRRRLGDHVAQFLDLEAAVDDESESDLESDEEEPFVVEDEAFDDVRPPGFTVKYLERAADEIAADEAKLMAEFVSMRARPQSTTQPIAVGETDGGCSWWVVPVRVGKEGLTAKRLKEVLPDFMKTVATPWGKGRVYVSAPSDVVADELIRLRASAISSAYLHRAIKQLGALDRQLLQDRLKNENKSNTDFEWNTWVRIRHGRYVGDVGQVIDASKDSDNVCLAVVPRIWPDGTETTVRGLERAPQALRVLGHKDLHPGPRPNTFFLRDVVYQPNGLRVLNVQGLHFVKNCDPTAHELVFFTMAGVDTLRATNKTLLRVTDSVIVISGSLKGKEGLVKRMDNESVRISTREGSEIEVSMVELERVFNVGDTISCVLGPLEGRSGIVVDVQDREVAFVDSSTNETMCYLKPFIRRDVQDTRMRNIPTIATMKARGGEKIHPAMYKVVYVRSLLRFGRVVGVKDGTQFLVEHKGMHGRSSFSASELIATDVWLTLDHQHVSEIDEVKRRFKTYVNQGFASIRPVTDTDKDKAAVISPGPRYIDTLPTRDHIVFVGGDMRFKKFGNFMGTNAKGEALVRFDGSERIYSFPASHCISMKTRHYLDGPPVNGFFGLKSLWTIYYKRYGKQRPRAVTPPPPSDISTPDSTGTIAATRPGNSGRESFRPGPSALPTPFDFVFSEWFSQIVLTHHVVFRFKAACETPRGVDGKMAWTTMETQARRGMTDVRLTYKTQDGMRMKDEYVPLLSLETCTPGLKKGDLALVVRGEEAGRVVYPSQSVREGKVRTGTLCTLEEKAKKKDAKFYSLDSVTRVTTINSGPPS